MKIKVARSVGDLTGTFPCYAATIGNFDGVHKGHREILARVIKKKHGTPCGSLLITFDPHPSAVLYPAKNQTMLSRLEKKVALLDEIGLDAVLVMEFTLQLAKMDPRDFVADTLLPLKVRELYVGHDFHFGSGRAGNAEFLAKEGQRHGFNVHQIEQVNDLGDRVGSTRIRQLLEEGKVEESAELLGRFHCITGTVVAGAGRGRRIGFPTCNLDDTEETVPAPGIYATITEWQGKKYGSVTHIGSIPTFGIATLSIETHLFGFREDIHGEVLEVAFVKRLRGVEKFGSVEDLVSQIAKDCLAAKEALKGLL